MKKFAENIIKKNFNKSTIQSCLQVANNEFNYLLDFIYLIFDSNYCQKIYSKIYNLKSK